MALPIVAFSLTFILYPFVALVRTASGGAGLWANVTSFWSSSTARKTLWVTCFDSAIVTVIALLLGALLAWSLHTTPRRWMRLAILIGLFVPMIMGAVIKIYSLTVLFQRAGIINFVLTRLHIVDQPVHIMFTQFAVVSGMVYQLLPFAVVPLFAVFATIDQDSVRAAQGLGASRTKALRSIVVPQATPGFLAAAILVYLIALGYFLTPVLLGGATSPFVASLVANDIFVNFNLERAATASVMLLLVGALIVVAGLLLVGGERLKRALG